MIRLGLRLALRSGREGLVRLVIMTVAVGIGVALLLGVLAEFHAFQVQSSQACWSCTQGATPVPQPLPVRGELWNNSVDFYLGQTITRVDLARLGPSAPVLPGVSALPAPGTYDASPALEALLKTVPADQLGDRFPGRLAETIGNAALTSPGQLVAYIGYQPSVLASMQGTQVVEQLATAPAPEIFTPFFRYAFGIGVLAVLFPILVLISTATRLAADRREERFAALRLIGGTPGDVRAIAAVESVLSAMLGTAAGIAVFFLVRPALAGAAVIAPFFPDSVMPTWWEFAAIVVTVPAAASAAALVSLRRVEVSPLGVARRTTPEPPPARRLIPLAAGVVLSVLGLVVTTHQGIGSAVYLGLILTMIGLVVAGPWLTAQAARLLGRVPRSSSSLLASRRLADNPRAAFRAVTGLVLAVFLATMVGTLVPAINAISGPPTGGPLKNVLLDTFADGSAAFSATCTPSLTGCVPPPQVTPAEKQSALGLTPSAGATLVRELNQFAGATAYPLYSLPQVANPQYQGVNVGVVGCDVLRSLPSFGSCPPGATAVQVDDSVAVTSDNPYQSTQAFASASAPPYTGSLAALSLQAVLVKVNSPATLERVRTFLAVHAPPSVSAGPGIAPTPPRTYGEASAIRVGRADLAEKLVYAAVAITLLVAGCSLAVAAGGGLVDRRRPFTLLRVGGTPVSVLARVVLLETAVPLATATVVAAAIAYGTSMLAFVQLAPVGTPVPRLGAAYYLLMGIGLAIAFAVITATIPLLRRMTAPAGVRFE
jgi:hypothetical protein